MGASIKAAPASRHNPEQVELKRIAGWSLTSRAVRAAVLLMAGLSRDRAGDTLDTFSNAERAAIRRAASMLEWDAHAIAMFANTGPAVH
ncbi:hypothetical protein IP92_02927 [Pseudoduganella flava]|uniref:Uncharacterized protein n=1 Tax=Pseudoduganella flava TaxID=871742 RepID=A0A562PQB0_9BURK|nr:hypothetical protein [Pseudoduganella flava]QGZ37759.1 hypothetical protein GO485_00935 [Pseudoduganella flava]TWI46568.1 hypothetical protein IP92_02927 [Pseudoduganella flava]